MTALERMRLLSARRRTIAHEQRVTLFVGIVLFFTCTDFFGIVMGDTFPDGAVKYLFNAAMLAFALINLRFLLRSIFGAPELALLLALVLVSMLWSIEPSLTFKRAMQIFSISLMAMALASMMSLRSLLMSLSAVLGMAMLLSLIAVLAFPDARGSEQWPNAWRGFFAHKNGLGANAMVELIVTWGAISVSRGWPRRVFQVIFAITLLLLMACESRTSQLVAVVCLGGLLVANLTRDHIRVWMVLFLGGFLFFGALLMFALFSGAADPVFDLIGRRPTLSNRIPLWGMLWPDILKEFWTGYGFGAYWNPESERVLRFGRIPLFGFEPHYSHNGLVEVLINIGFFGAVLMVISLVRSMIGASVAIRVKPMRMAGASSLAFLVAFMMLNFTESFVLNTNTYLWTFYVAIATKLGLLLTQKSRRWQRSAVSAARRPLPRGRRWAAAAGV